MAVPVLDGAEGERYKNNHWETSLEQGRREGTGPSIARA